MPILMLVQWNLGQRQQMDDRAAFAGGEIIPARYAWRCRFQLNLT